MFLARLDRHLLYPIGPSVGNENILSNAPLGIHFSQANTERGKEIAKIKNKESTSNFFIVFYKNIFKNYMGFFWVYTLTHSCIAQLGVVETLG